MSKQKTDGPQMSRGKKLVVGAMAIPAIGAMMLSGATPAFGMPGGGCCGGGQPADAALKSGVAKAAPKAAGSLLIDLGNTKCPVMGGTPNGKTFSEWHGLRIGHCCGGCTKTFAVDPETSLENAGIEWRDAADAVKKVNDAKGAAHVKALAALKSNWTVVREPAEAAKAKATGTLVDLANTNCPVRGAAVDGKSFSEWNGVRIGYCCPDCAAKLATDPEKYLNDAKIPWREAAGAAKAVDLAKGADRAKALAALKAKWKVVREPAAEAPAK